MSRPEQKAGEFHEVSQHDIHGDVQRGNGAQNHWIWSEGEFLSGSKFPNEIHSFIIALLEFLQGCMERVRFDHRYR